jgi:hypothetical protein
MVAAFDEVRIEDARALLEAARALASAHVDEAYQHLDRLLHRYEGIPARPNAFSLLEQQTLERPHQVVLAWLLDPTESHGLGDSFLRCFLARSGDPVAAARAAEHEPLSAQVFCEVALPEGRLDVLVVCRELVLSIEVKVFSAEHPLQVAGRDLPQSVAYAEQLRDPAIRDDVLGRYGATRLVGRRPHVLGVLVRRRFDAEESIFGNSEDDVGRESATVIDWLEVDDAVATCLSRVETPASARHFLLAFRTTLLETSGAEPPPLVTIERARVFVDMPVLRRRDSMEALRVATRFRKLGDRRNG